MAFLVCSLELSGPVEKRGGSAFGSGLPGKSHSSSLCPDRTPSCLIPPASSLSSLVCFLRDVTVGFPFGLCGWWDLSALCLRARWVSCVRLLQPYGLQPVRLLCPWGRPGKNTGVGSHFLL